MLFTPAHIEKKTCFYQNKYENENEIRRTAKLNEKGEKINNLIQCLSNFKSILEYKNVNFTADKLKMYESVREALAGIYIPLIPYPFPGRSNESLHENQIEEREVWEIQQKNKKEKTEKGCTRVHKKIKEIQQ